MPASKSNEEQIFLAALGEPDPDRRARQVAEACSDNQELRDRIEALLQSHFEAKHFLETPALVKDGRLSRTLGLHVGLEVGAVVMGRYRIDGVLGEGGMAVVYAAEQVSPVQRPVALKVIKPGLDTKQVVTRFEAERQALALMNHPHIASVLDGGTTDSGHPFFVMDRVEGPPITTYCDEHALPIDRRIELFLDVCRAVWHAHQKGIIHRDLKPSNVLIATQGQLAAPVVIDFGIAKATERRLTEHTLETGGAVFLGTPEYMSPEQADASKDLDTRTDIFALGALLRQLLTGSTHLDPRTLREMPYDRMLVTVREQEPSRPSTRLHTLGDDALEVARSRRTTPGRLKARLRGDLDWIVVKAMQNDRTRRYGGVGVLIEDLERYLRGDSVSAGPPNPIHRIRSTFRRHRPTFISAGLILLALLVGLGVAIRKAADERDARLRADALRLETQDALDRSESLRQLLARMVTLAEPRPGKSADYTVAEMLSDFGGDIDTLAADRPDVAAELHTLVGSALRTLDLREQAAVHFELALDLYRTLDDTPPATRSDAILDLVEMRQAYAQSDVQHWVELTNEALGLSYTPDGQPGLTTSRAMEVMGWIHHAGLNDAEALRWFHESLDVAEKLNNDRQASRLHSALATAYYSAGRNERSIHHARTAMQLVESLYDPLSHEHLRARSMLASSLARSGDAAEGCAMLIDVLEARHGLGLPTSVWSVLSLQRGVLRLQREADVEHAAVYAEHAARWFDLVPDADRSAEWGIIARDQATYHFMLGQDQAGCSRIAYTVKLFAQSERFMTVAVANAAFLAIVGDETGSRPQAVRAFDHLAQRCEEFGLAGFGKAVEHLRNDLLGSHAPSYSPAPFTDLEAESIDQWQSVIESMVALRFDGRLGQRNRPRMLEAVCVLAEPLIEARPDDPRPHLLLAVGRYNLGHYADALVILDRADVLVEPEPTPDTLVLKTHRIAALSATGRVDEAHTQYAALKPWLDRPDIALPELAMRALDDYRKRVDEVSPRHDAPP